MIQYRTTDGTLGEIDNNKIYSIEPNEHTFTITIRHYFYDEYEWEDEIIDNIIELRID